jgi:transposase
VEIPHASEGAVFARIKTLVALRADFGWQVATPLKRMSPFIYADRPLANPPPRKMIINRQEPQEPSPKKRRGNKPSATQHRINIDTKPDSAGIDIGAEEIVVAIPPDRCPDNVRTFTSFTGDLARLRDWLLAHHITTVAMESTSNYWVNCYDILEAAGIECCLVNARHVKGVPGKKTDVCDAQWLQQLHAAGLLKKSFRPAQEILPLRYLTRHRDSLVRESADHLRRMQKVLTEMNLKLHHVFSDIDGVSAQAIIKAILAGQRDPHVLAALRNGRCQSSEARILAALAGNYRPEYLFVLGQLQSCWEEQQQKLAALDAEIQAVIERINPTPRPAKNAKDNCYDKPGPRKRKQSGKNALHLDYPKESQRYFGTDLTLMDGIGPGVIVSLMSEIGSREHLLTSFKSADGFCAWLGLCPCNAISGGKVLRSATRKVKNRLSEALRLAAFGLERSKTKLGEFCRRMKGRLGKAEGITATAHKLARILYTLIANAATYDESQAFPVKPATRQKQLRQLQSLAKKLGLQVLPNPAVTTS